ncbi:MAG: hypothetical protein RLZ77_609 [Bacteroidota bacterium]|jgi:pectinesterase
MIRTFLKLQYTLLVYLYSVLLFSQSTVNNDFYKVVAQDGSGAYSSIQSAINDCKSFPYEKITIFIKKGVYKEKVVVNQWNSNLSLIGESKENTIISFADNFKSIGLGINSTFYTSTLKIESNDVILKNLTIENTSGDIGQAIALSVLSDRVIVDNCLIKGNQDTLFADGKGRQYYTNCTIEGTTDFIFGNATAYFENCEIRSKKNSFITAASTTTDTPIGFVFESCNFTADATPTHVYLGRPWRIYAKTVLLNCTLGKHIAAAGWDNWSKTAAEKTAFYAEFNSMGEGATGHKRVDWSHQLTQSQAQNYSLQTCVGTDFYDLINKELKNEK